MTSIPFRKRSAAALFALAGLGLFAASGASAQASTTGNVTAEILTALSVTETTALAFGKATTSGTTGTVVVSNAGAKSCTGGAGCVGTTAQQGVFDVTGQASTAVTITLPASMQVDDDTTGLVTMTVDGFNDDQSGAMTLSAGGAGTFNVGATLNVGANQTIDTYAGTYTVNVDYQ